MSIPSSLLIPITSTGSPTYVQVEYKPTLVRVINQTNQAAVPSATSAVISAYWQTGMIAGSAFLTQTLGGGTNPGTLVGNYIGSNGITTYQSGATLAVSYNPFSTLTATNPVTLTGVSTSLPTSGLLTIVAATGATQLVNSIFYFTRTGSVITLPYLNGTGFTAGTTGTFAILADFYFQVTYPTLQITSITTGTTTVVGFTTPCSFAVGQYIYLYINPLFGQQLAAYFTPQPAGRFFTNYPGYQITAVSGNTATLDINTSALTGTFSWPTNAQVSAQNTSLNPCTAGLVGQNTTLQTAYIAQAPNQFAGILLGSGVIGSAGNSLLIEVAAYPTPSANTYQG